MKAKKESNIVCVKGIECVLCRHFQIKHEFGSNYIPKCKLFNTETINITKPDKELLNKLLRQENL